MLQSHADNLAGHQLITRALFHRAGDGIHRRSCACASVRTPLTPASAFRARGPDPCACAGWCAGRRLRAPAAPSACHKPGGRAPADRAALVWCPWLPALSPGDRRQAPQVAPVGEPCGQSPAWWLYRHRHERPRRLMPAVSRPPPRPPAEHRRQNRRPNGPSKADCGACLTYLSSPMTRKLGRTIAGSGCLVAVRSRLIFRLRERPVPAKREAVAGTPICGEPAFRRRNTQRITVPEPCREWTVCSCLALPRYAGSPLRWPGQPTTKRGDYVPGAAVAQW